MTFEGTRLFLAIERAFDSRDELLALVGQLEGVVLPRWERDELRDRGVQYVLDIDKAASG